MFNTTDSLSHTTPLPSPITATKAIALLHDHEFFIHCDPHMTSFTLISDPIDPAPTVPKDRTPEVIPIEAPKCYTVTDKVHALPAGLWDKDVVSTYEFFDLENGVFVRIRSPLNVVLETVWSVRETEGGCELVEDVVIKCSRFLVGFVKGPCEANWKGIHAKMVDKLNEA